MKKLGIFIVMVLCLGLASFSALAADKNAPKPAQVSTQKQQSVFVTKTGKRFHASKSCSTLKSSKDVQQISMKDATQKKMTPCKVCYPAKK